LEKKKKKPLVGFGLNQLVSGMGVGARAKGTLLKLGVAYGGARISAQWGGKGRWGKVTRPKKKEIKNPAVNEYSYPW